MRLQTGYGLDRETTGGGDQILGVDAREGDRVSGREADRNIVADIGQDRL